MKYDVVCGCIGDEISSPDGDPYEVYRILFDLTFFFFVIVILLAIIQGQSASWCSSCHADVVCLGCLFHDQSIKTTLVTQMQIFIGILAASLKAK